MARRREVTGSEQPLHAALDALNASSARRRPRFAPAAGFPRVRGCIAGEDGELQRAGADVGNDRRRFAKRVAGAGEGAFQRMRLDVHHMRFAAAERERGFARRHFGAAAGGNQHLHLIRIGLGEAQHFEIERHFAQRKRNVLAGFCDDAGLELGIGERSVHLHHLLESRRAAHRCGGRSAPRARPSDEPPYRFTNGVHVTKLSVDDGAGRQRFDAARLYATAAGVAPELDELHRG